MFRIMQRWLGLAKPQAASKLAADTAVLLVRVPVQPTSVKSGQVNPVAARTPASNLPPPQHPTTRPDDKASPAASLSSQHIAAGAGSAEVRSAIIPANAPVAEPENLPLAALGVIPDRLLRKLRRAGLRSCEDLLAADGAALIKQIGALHGYEARIRRYQRAIRFSRRFTAMTPHEALLLFATHRRSAARLACETAGVLRRDLERLLLSSRGQKLAAGRSVPEIQRVRQWITEAKVSQERRKRALRGDAGHSKLLRLAPARNSIG